MSDRYKFSVTRLPIALWFAVIFLSVSTLVRLALTIINFGEVSSSWYLIPVSLIVGVIFDLYMALWITLPLVLLVLALPASWRASRWVRWPISFGAWLFTFGLMYLGVTELFFFDEFNSRLNYIAVDYLIYPHEVFVNLWDTYPVLTVMIITALLSLAVTWFTGDIRREGLPRPAALKARAGMLLTYAVLIAIGFFGLNIETSRISDNRALNEITANGVYSFAHAARTNEMDYNQYYARIDKGLAFNRLRHMLANDHTSFLDPDSSSDIDRLVKSDNALRKFNVVLVLEESFGSNFVGRLHPEGKCLTPSFDSLSAEHGLLFTNIYATGNRTVRGVEATLASFPPIPGRSIVKRPGCENVFTLSSLLKEKGYNTLFMYGGLSYFDNIGEFAAGNSYDRVIDELDFHDPTFKTIWGVCDEDLFGKAIVEFDSLQALGQPFFSTLITVSNHTPFTYPAGRIPFDPEDRCRENAVRYADYAIGKFINDARSHEFFDSTLFVFVADHGARVYGSSRIPILSYEIPLLFYNPVLNPEGKTCNVLGSQMDISPTILDYLGVDYESEFFGQSLLSTPTVGRPVLISHNRDVSLLRDSLVAVLGIEGESELWKVDDGGKELSRVEGTQDSSLVRDAIAFYMTAYDMFQSHALRPIPQK